MATVPTQIRIEENLKKQSMDLFTNLGMDMSSAVSIFLRQCVLRGGLPFPIEIPGYNYEVEEAIEEARAISKDSSTKRYSNMAEVWKDIDA